MYEVVGGPKSLVDISFENCQSQKASLRNDILSFLMFLGFCLCRRLIHCDVMFKYYKIYKTLLITLSLERPFLLYNI